MTLSQILANNPYYEGKTEIPPEGQWNVRVLIRDGKILNAWKEESIKEPEEEIGKGGARKKENR